MQDILKATMNNNDIKDCIAMMCENLPVLRELLNLKQSDVAEVIGTSRQQIIGFEHQESKITRSILISLITYFSLQPKTALFLRTLGLYQNKFVQEIGFNEQFMSFMTENKVPK
jgi:DNA-binding XRE family transcriptional regulator